MAHEIEIDETGRGKAFSTEGTMWHQAETNSHEISREDAPKTVEAACGRFKLNVPIELRPITWHRPVSGGTDTVETEIPGSRVVVRGDTWESLAVVGKDYTVCEAVDAYSPMQPLLDAGLMSLASGGVLRNGADGWLMGRWHITDPRVVDVFGDRIVPFSTITVNHTGQRGVEMMEHTMVVVCANTAAMARGEGKRRNRLFSVAHRRNVKSRTVEAWQEMYSDVVARYVTMAAQYDLLMRTYLDAEAFESLVLDVVAPLPTDPTTRNYNGTLARQTDRRDRLSFLRNNGKGMTGNGSAWEAYNAVTESVDHDADMWKLRGDVTRVESMMGGTLSGIKNAALDSLYAYAEARR